MHLQFINAVPCLIFSKLHFFNLNIVLIVKKKKRRELYDVGGFINQPQDVGWIHGM